MLSPLNFHRITSGRFYIDHCHGFAFVFNYLGSPDENNSHFNPILTTLTELARVQDKLILTLLRHEQRRPCYLKESAFSKPKRFMPFLSRAFLIRKSSCTSIASCFLRSISILHVIASHRPRHPSKRRCRLLFGSLLTSDLLVDLTWSLSSDLEPVARDGQLDKKAFRRQYSLPEVRLQHRGAGQLSDPFYRLCVFS